ncbi:hypothetical protein [Pseudoclavibacter sp. RFBB5]|uniref:hypothetical protein n=1 Tax=Pseudoclavibacter sp. RFBB5 TaxID=2080574 RepID=UPI000CE79968|nr:hypothetical protein [Pseudoclavibacter sp. RFBB5]PPG28121.1 hypothetical protein C5B97_14720 [Pseudoclavibacter sp. RFBB5]
MVPHPLGQHLELIAGTVVAEQAIDLSRIVRDLWNAHTVEGPSLSPVPQPSAGDARSASVRDAEREVPKLARQGDARLASRCAPSIVASSAGSARAAPVTCIHRSRL